MKKPVIAIIPRCDEDYELKRSIQYVFDDIRNSILEIGAIPFILTPVNNLDYYHTKWNDFKDFTVEEIEIMEEQLKLCDGLFLPGGYKFTKYDMKIIELALKNNMPILGVCLGMQSLSSLGKNIELEKIKSDINHRQDFNHKYCHSIRIKDNSILYSILKKKKIEVNSFHKMKTTNNPLFNVVAVASDGVIEAIEMKDRDFVIGLQWHPEKMLSYDDNARLIMKKFRDKCMIYHENKNAKVVML